MDDPQKGVLPGGQPAIFLFPNSIETEPLKMTVQKPSRTPFLYSLKLEASSPDKNGAEIEADYPHFGAAISVPRNPIRYSGDRFVQKFNLNLAIFTVGILAEGEPGQDKENMGSMKIANSRCICGANRNLKSRIKIQPGNSGIGETGKRTGSRFRSFKLHQFCPVLLSLSSLWNLDGCLSLTTQAGPVIRSTDVGRLIPSMYSGAYYPHTLTVYNALHGLDKPGARCSLYATFTYWELARCSGPNPVIPRLDSSSGSPGMLSS
ncbi:hypothetical protein DFH06DRAFT_1131738 [Mycena polygramma]|nr:hypothetical protein DFH06DRAFT_1131738 [Mycena polygramma]